MDKIKFEYILRLADDALIIGQRLSEWCGHGPVLEEDIALSNTSLDYIGQATNLFKYASELESAGRDEDAIAFVREETEYKNLLLLELPNGDYANTIARQFFYSVYMHLFLEKQCGVQDEFLSGYAAKSIKEVRYHMQHATDWMLRLGDGTEESHQRMQAAVNHLWSYTGEMFLMDETDRSAFDARYGVDKSVLKSAWNSMVAEVLKQATLDLPEDGWGHSGGRSGKHTEHMGFLLAELQYLQRTYPGAKW
jgi:ring-1,2-phenylacetyl-CoA epoxidase subunit PaaC